MARYSFFCRITYLLLRYTYILRCYLTKSLWVYNSREKLFLQNFIKLKHVRSEKFMMNNIPSNETSKCKVCDHESYQDGHTSESTLWRCPACTHCFAQVHAEQETYSDEYFVKSHRAWFENPMYEYFSKLHTLLVTKEDLKILDVGCGLGQFLIYLYKKNPNLDLTGVDLVKNEHSHIRFLSGDILNLDISEQYDVVTSLATIEHIDDVQGFMRKLLSLTKNGGRVMVMTVNERGLFYKIARVLNRIGPSSAYERLYEKHHVNHFTTQSFYK